MLMVGAHTCVRVCVLAVVLLNTLFFNIELKEHFFTMTGLRVVECVCVCVCVC